jgi:hypothetical protein
MGFADYSSTVRTATDFWLSCGHHLLDRDETGNVVVTDEFLRVYLARPEIAPAADACPAERVLHRTLFEDPRASISPQEIEAVADADARENWQVLLSWRDHLLQRRTLEAAYLAIVREDCRFPALFVDQIVQVILRNVLDDCDDVFVLRAAELFFRPQKLAVYGGSLLAADVETFSGTLGPAPLAALLGLQTEPDIEVLRTENAASYWERSDSFNLALDLTAGRRGLAALGEVVRRWVRHLLRVDLDILPMSEVREITLTWYVGLDSNATRIGDALWRGEPSSGTESQFIVGLYCLRFPDDTEVLEEVQGEPTYLIVGASSAMSLRLKPQNLITGLPLRQASEVCS